MKNTLFLPLTIMWRAKRPSSLTDMPALYNRFWLRKGYAALTFFGTILTTSEQDADYLNQGGNSLKVHEMIHLRQAQSVHDSWILFYICYLWYYLGALWQCRHMKRAAYFINPFEMEAYHHMDDPHYLARCTNGAEGWRTYAKMKTSERLTFYLEHIKKQ